MSIHGNGTGVPDSLSTDHELCISGWHCVSGKTERTTPLARVNHTLAFDTFAPAMLVAVQRLRNLIVEQ